MSGPIPLRTTPLPVEKNMQGVLTSVPIRSAARSPWAGLFIPSIADFLFAALLIWLFAGGGGKMLLGDGDTGWHIRTGDYVLENHAVPRKDIFTFTRPDEPWLAWEWLSDVIFASLHRSWGLKGVVILAGVVLCSAATFLFCRMVGSGGNLFLALAAALLANGAASVHYLARPHIFTLLLLAISLWILDRDRRRNSSAVWLLVPLTAVWVNLHGGFLALIACLGLTAAGSAIEALLERRPLWVAAPGGRWPAFRRYSLLAGACSLATFVNPYGYSLHLHILQYLRSSFIMDAVEEFQSPKFRHENMFHFELLLFAGLGLVGLLVSKRRWVEALLILFWAQAALGSVRHVPLFAFVVAPLLVQELTALWNEWSATRTRGSIAGILRDLCGEFSNTPMRTTLWAPALIASIALAKGQSWPSDFPTGKFPVVMVNRYESDLVPAAGPMPRIFTSDQWGDYLTYRFYPRVRVFLDGRSDLFGAELGKEYVRLAGGQHEWEKTLDRYRIEMAMIPSDWPLAELLKRHAGWRIRQDDGSAILFERKNPILMKRELSAELLGQQPSVGHD